MPFSCLAPDHNRNRSIRNRQARAFTLLELLVTLAIVLVICVALSQFVDETGKVWKSAATDHFVEAQQAFDTVAQNLAAATLEPYQDYANSSGSFRISGTANFSPDHLARRSDLDFVCGPAAGASGLLAGSNRTATGSAVFFLAPQGYSQTYPHQGMQQLLNACGYFVEFSDDSTAPSFVLSQSHFWRWRLKQVQQPTESLQIFAAPDSPTWLAQVISPQTPDTVLAENILTLIVLPERAAADTTLAPTFSYDSRNTTNKLTLHQLPPCVHLALVAMDDVAAQQLADRNGSVPPQLVPATLFQQATQLSADLATLDQSLTAQQIQHRIFQRDIRLPAADWSETPSP